MIAQVQALVDGINNGSISAPNAQDAIRQCGGDAVVIMEMARAITPINSAAVATIDAVINPIPRAFMVEETGTVTVDLYGTGSAITLGVVAGVIYPIRIRKLSASTAGDVTLLW